MPIVLGGGSFTATTPPPDAPTLATLERELASRTGPFLTYPAATGSTAGFVRVDEVASTLQQADRVGLWLLRRGIYADNSPVAGFWAGDRVRLVASQDFGAGTSGFAVDRDWVVPPVVNEPLELMALDPVQSLRRAVRRGLARAMVEDVAVLTLSTPAVDRDLTAEAWWLTEPGQLVDVLAGPTDGSWAARPVERWQPYKRGGHLWIRVEPDPAPAALWVRALRARSTWVNGHDQLGGGPVTDTDVLTGTVAEITCFAHDWLWDSHKDQLQPLVARGYGTPEADVRRAANAYRARWQRRVDRVIGPTIFEGQLEPGGATWGGW